LGVMDKIKITIFRGSELEIRVFLGYYAAYTRNAPIRCVMSQKSAHLIYIAAED